MAARQLADEEDVGRDRTGPRRGDPVPLHEGARRYYRERQLESNRARAERFTPWRAATPAARSRGRLRHLATPRRFGWLCSRALTSPETRSWARRRACACPLAASRVALSASSERLAIFQRGCHEENDVGLIVMACATASLLSAQNGNPV